MENTEIVRGLRPDQARVNVTYGGVQVTVTNGDLPDPVSYDASDDDIKQWVTEAVRGGGIPGIPADPRADFSGYMVDRSPACEERPYALLMVRPKTSYGHNG